MSELRITSPLLERAPPTARAGLPADLAFCHPDIRGIVRISETEVVLDVAAESADLHTQVTRVIELSLRSYRFVPAQAPLWAHGTVDDHSGTDPLAQFIATHTIELGPGQYALVGPAAQLRAALDMRLARLAAEVGAEPWHLPSIEQTADLVPATGYLAASAQYVTFGYRLPCHFEHLRRFTEAARSQQLERPADPRDLEPAGFILEPVVCHNVYRALRDARLDGGRTITALGTCYRHEGFRFQPLLRQWEFSMREAVLVGSAAYVSAQRERLVDATQQLVRDLDLPATLEIATDPFFVGEAASARTYQALNSTKLELLLALDASSRTAAASFNFHGTHFTTPMRIAGMDGRVLETACVGWGLERWMAAVVCRWGADHQKWPTI